jgi:hypothetical protein
MDIKAHEAKVARASKKRVATALIFVAASGVTFWLAYLLFTSTDCGETGSRLAWVVVSACAIVGADAAATMLVALGAAMAWLAWTSGNLTARRTGTRA